MATSDRPADSQFPPPPLQIATLVAAVSGSPPDLDLLAVGAEAAGYATRRCEHCGRDVVKLYDLSSNATGSARSLLAIQSAVDNGGDGASARATITAVGIVERPAAPTGAWATLMRSSSLGPHASYEFFVDTWRDADGVLRILSSSLGLSDGTLTVRFPAGWQGWGRA